MSEFVAKDKSEIVGALPKACSDESAAVEFMEKRRWGDHPACPRCGDTSVYKFSDPETGERHARFLWKCKGCKRQFTVRIGTVFEDSRIPMRHWCYAFWAACSSKKGVSALQIKRMTGLSYKSALFLMHRIRWAMSDSPKEKLRGIVEADETYVGGKPRFLGQSRAGRGTKKQAVFAVVQRGGSVRTFPIKKATREILKEAILQNVDLKSRLMTDDYLAYRKIGKPFEGGHEAVKHSRKQYVKGDCHTNTVEGFFSLVKRGIYGTYHSVSKKHLHRYLSEFEFRYNSRKADDGERVELAIQGADGKRLLYKEPIAG